MRIYKAFTTGITVLLWALLACGGSGSESTRPALTVTPDPAPAVTAGGSGVAFTAALVNSTDTINWTLTPSAGSGTVSSATGANTTYTPPVSVVASTTVTLTATAGTLTDSVTIIINPPATITVTGKVVAATGAPVPNASVMIGSQSAISDADGSFTIPNVTTPYDLVSIVNTPDKRAVVYKKLTRADPTILQIGLISVLPNSGTVTGDVEPPLYTKNYVAWGSPETTRISYFTANPYSLNLSWRGPSSTTGTVHALKWSTDPSGLPAVYRGFGSQAGVSLADSGTTTVPEIAMTSVTPAHISGSISLPASYTLASKSMEVVFSSGATIPILADSTSTENFNYLTPSGIDGSITLNVTATNGSGVSVVSKSGLAADAADVTLAPQEMSIHGLPVNGGTGITTDTDFSWTQFTNGIHVVIFMPTMAPNPTFFVVTTETTTKIPDLSAQGLGLPSGGTNYGWTINAFAPWASIDDFAGGHTVFPADTSSRRYESMCAARSFTTQ